MNEQDKQAFEAALVERCKTTITVPQDFSAGWQAGLEYARGKHEPVAGVKWKLVPAGSTLEVRQALEGKTGVDFLLAYADFYRGNYPAPAVAVNEQMLAALKSCEWNSLDLPEFVRVEVEAAIRAAEAAKGGV